MNRRILVTATCAVLFLSSVAQPNNNNLTPPPHGQPMPADSSVASTSAFLERDRATGDWGGYRTSLEERGVDVGLAIWADLFQNVRGGANTADLDFMHVESLTVLVDTEKLSAIKAAASLSIFSTSAATIHLTTSATGNGSAASHPTDAIRSPSCISNSGS